LSAALVAACAHSQPEVASAPTAATPAAASSGAETEGGGKVMTSKYLTRGLYCQSSNKTAVEVYNQAIEAGKAKALDQAEQLYKRALELDPNFCDAMDNLGQVYRMRGNDADAIPLYEKSAKLSPNNPVPRQNLGNVYIRARRYEDALREWDAVIAIDASDPEGHFGRGRTLMVLKRHQDAMKEFKLAEAGYERASSPLIWDARYMQGAIYMELGDWVAVRDVYEPMAARFAGDGYLQLALGTAYASASKIHDAAKARQYLTRARELGENVSDELWKKVQP
jgi:tetratricopeptide (TPR) repeat protein